MDIFVQPLKPHRRNQRGFILIFVLVFLSISILLGLAALNTSNVEIQISGNERCYKTAFYAAEAGIEAGCSALNTLKTADSGSWDRLINGTQSLNDYIDDIGDRNTGLGTFTLLVRDNDDLDGTTLVDSDNMIILTSVGQYKDASVSIETGVRYTGTGGQYIQEHYDTVNSGDAATESDSISGSIRWN